MSRKIYVFRRIAAIAIVQVFPASLLEVAIAVERVKPIKAMLRAARR